MVYDLLLGSRSMCSCKLWQHVATIYCTSRMSLCSSCTASPRNCKRGAQADKIQPYQNAEDLGKLHKLHKLHKLQASMQSSIAL